MGFSGIGHGQTSLQNPVGLAGFLAVMHAAPLISINDPSAKPDI
jgi:hypothetical protein